MFQEFLYCESGPGIIFLMIVTGFALCGVIAVEFF